MFSADEAWFALNGSIHCHSDKFGFTKAPIHFLKLFGMALNPDTNVSVHMCLHTCLCVNTYMCAWAKSSDLCF